MPVTVIGIVPDDERPIASVTVNGRLFDPIEVEPSTTVWNENLLSAEATSPWVASSNSG